MVGQWIKAVGGPLGVAITAALLWFVVRPLAIAVIVLGLGYGLYRWPRFPFTISRRRSVEAHNERRELLGLAQAVKTELETCQHRLYEAKYERHGWYQGRRLPAETYNSRWNASPITADEVAANDALRNFYIWADDMNAKMSERAAAEYRAIGTIMVGKTLTLDDEDLAELKEGGRKIANARAELNALIRRLSN
jgi:hypothetical protein